MEPAASTSQSDLTKDRSLRNGRSAQGLRDVVSRADAIRLADQLTLNDPILITSARLEEIIIDHTLDILNSQSLAKINSTPVVSEQLDYIDDAEAWSMGIVNQGPQMCVAYMIELRASNKRVPSYLSSSRSWRRSLSQRPSDTLAEFSRSGDDVWMGVMR